jgi:AcrR family transcriptional regulator
MPTGRRDERRIEVRRRIEAAAYELFAERGYAQTTTAAVADRAGVSPRTLFRYFPAKADLLFGESLTHAGVLLDAVRARPAGEPALLAALAGAQVLAGQLDDVTTRQRASIVMEEPGMAARAQQVIDAWIDELTLALGDRVAGDEQAARVVATSVVHLLNQAVLAWTSDGARPGALPAMVGRLGAALVPTQGLVAP